MRRSWVTDAALVWTCSAALLGGCSALIDVSGTQCDDDAQCVSAGLGKACEAHVCVGEVDTGQSMQAVSDGHCTQDGECSSAAPRCMRGQCVAQEVADQFLCSPQEQADPSATVHYSFKVIEFVSRKPPGTVSAKACRTNDVVCSDPVATFQDKDGSGMVELDLPSGFLGYFEVKSDALTALLYLTKPIVRDTVDRDLQVSSLNTVMLLSMTDGTTLDRARGLALVQAFDCTGKPAGGVHFTESKGDSHPFFIVNHVPNSDVQLSVYDPATDIAAGGFLNVQPGFVTFNASYGVDGPLLGEFNASVRADTITFVYMYF
jgi:hypothetical protein